MIDAPYLSIKEECEVEFDEGKTFFVPPTCTSIPFKNCNIIVNELNGTFVVFFSTVQSKIFSDIRNSCSIGEMKKKYADDIDDLSYVLAALIDSGLLSSEPAIFEPIEKNLYLYVTNQCNLSCLHCYRKLTTSAGEPLTAENWNPVLKQFSVLGKNVTISGGEPMLYPEIVLMIEQIKSFMLNVTVLSNGTGWENVFAGRENLIPLIDEIQISIDGYDEASNRLIRRAATFHETMNNIVWLNKHNATVSVAVTAHPDILFSTSAYHRLQNFLAALSEKGIFIRLTKKILPNKGISLNRTQLKRYTRLITSMEEAIYPGGRTKKWASFYGTKERERNCGWGGLTIDAYGSAFVCNRIDELNPIGSVLRDDLEKIYSIARAQHELTSVDNIPTCKECPIRYLCNGGCRLDQFTNLHGKLNRKCSDDDKAYFYQMMIEAVGYVYGLSDD